MGRCSQCGVSIPDGQRICSMCYGDIDHGTDGHYRRVMEEEARKAEERKKEEEEHG